MSDTWQLSTSSLNNTFMHAKSLHTAVRNKYTKYPHTERENVGGPLMLHKLTQKAQQWIFHSALESERGRINS